MSLGALWLPTYKTRDVAERIRDFKVRHELSPKFEIKWTKVSRGKFGFYRDVMDYFFDDDDLHFRAIVIPDKSKLRHDEFGQSHDDWYYKMYYHLLTALIEPDSEYFIYLDIKDTRGANRARHLHKVLCSSQYDHMQQIIRRVQVVRSDEVEQQQLVDLLLGCVSYANRVETGDVQPTPAKMGLVERMRHRSRYNLLKSTLLKEQKVNIFRWTPRASAP